MKSDLAVVITTINPPATGINAWLSFGNATLIVVGDTKTPHSAWRDISRESKGKIRYFDCEAQEQEFPELSNAIGWKTYARKNIGYLLARRLGFSQIFETDDDTFPGALLTSRAAIVTNLEPTHEATTSSSGVFWNPYNHFAAGKKIWARGTPLQWINSEQPDALKLGTSLEKGGSEKTSPNMVQFLVNNEPDLDAIFRLTNITVAFDFPESMDIVKIPKGMFAPANTQATFFRSISDVTPMYFPSTISLRIADILKMYVAQVCIPLSYGGFNVIQHRNPHDYFSDFILEVEMYKHAAEWIEVLSKIIEGQPSVQEAYTLLVRKGFVPAKELEILSLFEAEAQSLQN
jgi:hypothetical protein